MDEALLTARLDALEKRLAELEAKGRPAAPPKPLAWATRRDIVLRLIGEVRDRAAAEAAGRSSRYGEPVPMLLDAKRKAGSWAMLRDRMEKVRT